MKKTLDTTGIEELFIETPVRGARVSKVKHTSTTKAKPLFIQADPLAGVSTSTILRELLKRHYKVIVWDLVLVGVGALLVVLT